MADILQSPDASYDEVDRWLNKWYPEGFYIPSKSYECSIKEEDMDCTSDGECDQYPLLLEGIDSNGCYEECNNLDLYSMRNDKELSDHVQSEIEKYKIGTCGPPEFYGKYPPHILLRDQINQWMECGGSILYSSRVALLDSIPFAFVSNDSRKYWHTPKDGVLAPMTLESLSDYSKIANNMTRSFSKLAIVDEKINDSLLRSLLVATGGACFSFSHNDPVSLASLLEELSKIWGCKFDCFLFLEGVYERDGTLCPLKNIMRVVSSRKSMYSQLKTINVILDDTMAIGVLGERRRGSWEYFGMKLEEFYLVYSGLDVLCCNAAICYGSKKVISHQILASSGYTFSASPPTFSVSAASFILENVITTRYGVEYQARLYQKSSLLRQALEPIAFDKLSLNVGKSCPDILPFICVKSSWTTCCSIDEKMRSHLGIKCFLRNDSQTEFQGTTSPSNEGVLMIVINLSLTMDLEMVNQIVSILMRTEAEEQRKSRCN